ncbi:SDR family oxidoreductase [Actinomadura luteofluorescens]|uniref:SDR family oxidoreductase n=1 Tax=Actinomadura luteofluorescens TaxID=46163 RepID=UPI00363B2F8E
MTIADRDAGAAARAAGELDVRAVTMDVTDAASVTAGVAEATAALGPIEVLVNNAGVVAGGGPLVSLPLEVFDTVVAVNLRGTFTVTQAVAGQMIESGTRGRIVNISSIGARQPTAASATTRPPRPPWTPSRAPPRWSSPATASGSTASRRGPSTRR